IARNDRIEHAGRASQALRCSAAPGERPESASLTARQLAFLVCFGGARAPILAFVDVARRACIAGGPPFRSFRLRNGRRSRPAWRTRTAPQTGRAAVRPGVASARADAR